MILPKVLADQRIHLVPVDPFILRKNICFKHQGSLAAIQESSVVRRRSHRQGAVSQAAH